MTQARFSMPGGDEPTVLLIRPLCAQGEPEFAEPLGIERLAGYLRAHGVSRVRVFDRRLYAAERRAGLSSADAPSFFEEIRTAFAGSEGPGVVGVSLMTADDVGDARRLISRLHAMFPQATMLAGGVYVTTNPVEAARELPRGTILHRGEGESALLSLVRGHSGSTFVSPDEWAPAYRPDLVRYARLGCAVNVQTSRGCPGHCSFCATPQLPDELRRWRPRSLDSVVDEIADEAARLDEMGLPAIFNFVDDDFGPLTRLEELADELEGRGLSIAFACEMRMAALAGQKHLTQRLTRLAAAGLTRVFVGVESLELQTLREWKKPYDVKMLPEVLAACEAADVVMQAGYILWHGNQTVSGALDEVRRLYEMGIYSHRTATSRLIVLPGCELAACDQALSLGNGKTGRGSGSLGQAPHNHCGKGQRVGAPQALGPAEEQFYQTFAQRTEELTRRWTMAAIKEPYEAARAFLTGDCARLKRIRAELADVNERSYELFVTEASHMVSMGSSSKTLCPAHK